MGNISPGSRRTNKRFPKGQGGCISIYVHVQCTVFTERPFSVSLIFLLATDGVKYEVCTPPARTGGSMYPSRWYHLHISTWQMWKNFMNFVTNTRYAPARTGRSVCPFQVIPSADAVLASAKIGGNCCSQGQRTGIFCTKRIEQSVRDKDYSLKRSES